MEQSWESLPFASVAWVEFAFGSLPFSKGFFRNKLQYSKFQFDLKTADEEHLHEMCHWQFQFMLFILLLLKKKEVNIIQVFTESWQILVGSLKRGTFLVEKYKKI